MEMRALDPLHDEYIFTVSDRASGKAAVFDLVDRLGATTRRKLGVAAGGPGGASEPVAGITTTSPKAWELLFRARQAFDQGRVEEAGNLARTAVAEDPDFALAHYLVAEAAVAFVNGWTDPDRSTMSASCWARSPSARPASREGAALAPGPASPGGRLLGRGIPDPRPDRGGLSPRQGGPAQRRSRPAAPVRGGVGDPVLPAGPPARSRVRLRDRASCRGHREFRECARAPALAAGAGGDRHQGGPGPESRDCSSLHRRGGRGRGALPQATADGRWPLASRALRTVPGLPRTRRRARGTDPAVHRGRPGGQAGGTQSGEAGAGTAPRVGVHRPGSIRGGMAVHPDASDDRRRTRLFSRNSAWGAGSRPATPTSSARRWWSSIGWAPSTTPRRLGPSLSPGGGSGPLDVAAPFAERAMSSPRYLDVPPPARPLIEASVDWARGDLDAAERKITAAERGPGQNFRLAAARMHATRPPGATARGWWRRWSPSGPFAIPCGRTRGSGTSRKPSTLWPSATRGWETSRRPESGTTRC